MSKFFSGAALRSDTPNEPLPDLTSTARPMIKGSQPTTRASSQQDLETQLDWLAHNQSALDERILKIEQSLLFRLIRWPGKRYVEFRNRMRRGAPDAGEGYAEWLQYERSSLLPRPEDCAAQLNHFTTFPIFVVVLAVKSPRVQWLKEAIESVRNQIYPHWELRICIEGDLDPVTAGIISEVEASDPNRIKSHRSSGEGWQAAVMSADRDGEYLALLQQHDQLSPYALFFVTAAVQSSKLFAVYTDHDSLTASGERVCPVFKPAWSPDLVQEKTYLSGLLVVAKEIVAATDLFRRDAASCPTAETWRGVTAHSNAIEHIPRILLHQRLTNDETDQLTGTRDRVSPAAVSSRLASLVVCSRSPRLLKNALRSIRKRTSYSNYEVIIAEHCVGGQNASIADLAREYDCQWVPVYGSFNFAAFNNEASRYARGDVIGFLNDDIEPLDERWLDHLMGALEVPDTGIAGAKLLYPSGALQHGGVVVGIGDGAGHVNRHRYGGGYWKWTDEKRTVSAVTGACLFIKTSLFHELGGFDVSFHNNYNDVDLCLRAGAVGDRVVYEPAAVLRHYEGQTRELVVRYDERFRFFMRWHERIKAGDPYYNPNLTLAGEDASLNFEVETQMLHPR